MENDLRRWMRLVESEQAARRFIIKPAPGVGKHTVFENGAPIAEIWFERTRWRNDITTRGKLTLRDGRSTDLSGYSYFADVKRHLTDLISRLEGDDHTVDEARDTLPLVKATPAGPIVTIRCK
jgi:hypothetical protein